MRLVELGVICRDQEKILEQLQEWKIIPTAPNYLCKKCGGSLKLGRSERDADGWRWFCSNNYSKNKQKRKRCGTQVSIRTGTFFSKSHLPIFQIFAFINLWLSNLELVFIGHILGVNHGTLVTWAAFCREVVLTFLIESSEPLGGEERTIEIYESKFENAQDDESECANEKSVVSGYEQESGRVFIVPIADNSAETLISVIREWIVPGSTIIIGDWWDTYDLMEKENFEHLMVSHNVVFKDPETHTHRDFIQPTPGNRHYSVAGKLAKRLFIQRCEKLKIDQVKEFLRVVGKIYNPTLDECDTKKWRERLEH